MNRTWFFSLTSLLLMMTVSLHAHPVVNSDARARIQQVTPEQMQQAILDYVRLQKEETIADVQVRLLEPEGSVSLPSGTLGMRVRENMPVGGYGRRQVDVALSINGKVVQIVKALADVTALVDVAVATRVIRIDETIQADDVRMTRMPLVAARQYATNLDEVIGKRAARTLALHAPIYTAALAPPYLVRKGDLVTIEAKRKGLLIQAIGITKAVGQVGQMVTVTNQDSGKDLRAKVIAPGLVRVEF
jgi:flagella basal body P-ring formation protein FlgA